MYKLLTSYWKIEIERLDSSIKNFTKEHPIKVYGKTFKRNLEKDKKMKKLDMNQFHLCYRFKSLYLNILEYILKRKNLTKV